MECVLQGAQGGEEGEQANRCVRAHSAAMTVLQRSPFRPDLILTMGAWSFAVWMDGALKAPLCQSPAAPAMYSAGCWSPARPGALPSFPAVLTRQTSLDMHHQKRVSDAVAWQMLPFHSNRPFSCLGLAHVQRKTRRNISNMVSRHACAAALPQRGCKRWLDGNFAECHAK